MAVKLTARQAQFLRDVQGATDRNERWALRKMTRAALCCLNNHFVIRTYTGADGTGYRITSQGREALRNYVPVAMPDHVKERFKNTPRKTVLRDLTAADVAMAMDHAMEAMGLHEPPVPPLLGVSRRLHRAEQIDVHLRERVPHFEARAASYGGPGRGQITVTRRYYHGEFLEKILAFLRLDVDKKTRYINCARGHKPVMPGVGIPAIAPE